MVIRYGEVWEGVHAPGRDAGLAVVAGHHGCRAGRAMSCARLPVLGASAGWRKRGQRVPGRALLP